MTDSYERESRRVRRVSIVGMAVNLSLAVAKAIGGFLFHSQALLADAVDSTSDIFTDMVTIAAVRYSRRPVDRNHPYGHGRFESLASLIIGTVMLGAATWLAVTAVQTLIHGRENPVGWPAAVIATISFLGKGGLQRYTKAAALQARSPALYANAINYRNDMFISLTVVVGVLGSVLIPGAGWLDSAGSLVVSGVIVFTALRVVLSSVHDLTDMEQNPSLIDELKELAMAVDDVQDAHRIRTRRYGSLVYVDMDIEVPPAMTVAEGHDIAHKVKDLILDRYEYVADALIHLEPEGSRQKGEGPVRGAPEEGVPNG